MFTKQILSGARDKLEDWKGYGQGRELWKDLELLGYLNNAYNDWARQTLCFKDSSAETICKILLLANQHTYPMDQRIVAIHKGRLLSGWPHIEPKDELWLDEYVYSWETRTGDPRYVVPDYEAAKLRIVPYFNTEGYYSGAFTFTEAGKIIAQVGTNFVTYLSAGDKVVITGTTLNNGNMTVATSSQDFFTVVETITDETSSAAVIQKVRDTLWLSTSRLPLTQLSMASDSEQPEINFDYHPKLIHGILREAYEKDGTQTLDPRSADKFRLLFQADIIQAKKEKYRLRHTARVLRPNPGTL